MHKNQTAKILAKLLADNDLNPTSAAKAIGLNQSTVQRIVKGEIKNPKTTILESIADFFGISVEQLIGRAPMTGEVQESSPVNYLKSNRGESVLVPRMTAMAGMGKMIGVDGDHDTVINNIEVSKQYLASQLGTITNPKNLRLIAGIGDSMRGVFKSGDTLFVDTGVNAFVTEATYVFQFDDHIWIKELARNGKGGYTIISANKRFKDVNVMRGDKSFRIIGMVLGVLNLKKLV